MTPKFVRCIVCDVGSHRLDWQNNPAPACDSHSEKEVAAAKARGPKPVAPKPKPVSGMDRAVPVSTKQVASPAHQQKED